MAERKRPRKLTLDEKLDAVMHVCALLAWMISILVLIAPWL